jgi:peptide/nickel transport system substrate-binding protein
MPLSRRALLGVSGLAAAPAPPVDWAGRPARAQQERVLRYGISMADIPQTSGQPDRGAGAYQFTGHSKCTCVYRRGEA